MVNQYQLWFGKQKHVRFFPPVDNYAGGKEEFT